MVKTSSRPSRLQPWRVLVMVVVLAATAYVLVRNAHILFESLQVVAGVSWQWIAGAVSVTLLTFFIAAAIYQQLSLKPLRYLHTVAMELAAACVNRLLPAGLGSLGLHGVYLYKRKHTAAQATAVVSINNLIGMVAHLTLLTGVLLLSSQSVSNLQVHKLHVNGVLIAAVVVGLAVVLYAVPFVRTRIALFVRHLLESFRLYAKTPWRVVRAFVLAMFLTTTYTSILYVAAHGVGLSLGFVQCFMVFSIGMLVGTATPTPGGLVGAEAGLFAGFVAYGASAPTAGAAVVFFRLTTYWLPIIPGALALLFARRRGLV